MKPLTECLACGLKKFQPLIDLGEQPLANNLGSEEKYPLAVQYCENCFHGQLTVSVDPEILYRDYKYVSGTSDTLNGWFKGFSNRFQHYEAGRVLDIAGNDGSLLKHFKNMGWEVLNVDPATNLKSFNDDLGIEMVTEFWNEEVASSHGQFDVICAFNVLAHTPDPLTILKGIKKALKPGGRAFIMTSQMHMLATGQFDTIYHEHHSFFTQDSMRTLLDRVFKGYVYTFDSESVNGQSMMVEVSRPYLAFNGIAKEVITFIQNLPEGTVGYGAAAKATVQLNAAGRDLVWIADENPLKQGFMVPGTKTPIVSPDVLLEDNGNLDIYIPAWNLSDEIMHKVKELRPNKHDRFHIPFPWPKTIGNE